MSESPNGANAPDQTRPERPLGVIAATSVVVLATLVTGLNKVGRSFNYDEAFTYAFFINGGSPRRALTEQYVFNNHPMFSLTQTIGWRLGLVGESAQRLGPVVCGAVTVGLLTWFVGRRFGATAGFASGVFLLLNPIFVNEFRSLRGYSLATMCVLVAAVAIERSWRDPQRRWLWAQGVAMVMAVTTHSYSALSFAALAAAALVLGRVERRHVITWVAAALAALLIAAPVLDDARRNAELRGTAYLPWFGRFMARSLFGYEWLPVVVIGGLTLAGVVWMARRSQRDVAALGAALAVFVGVILLLWQVLQPRDLYPRFFVSALPFFAGLAGVGAGALRDAVAGRVTGRAGLVAPGLVVIAVVVAAVGLRPGVDEVLAREPTIRDGAAFATAARAEGLEVCGRHAEPLSVYTAPVRLIDGVDDFGDCELYVAVLSLDAQRRDAAIGRFGSELNLGGGVRVFGPADVLDRLSS